MKTYTKELLEIKVYDTRDEMGACAAKEAAAYIRELMTSKDEVNIVFAAAPSQNDFLLHLSKEDIEWGRINAYHMDEYIGLAKDAPQGFGNYLAEHIFNLVPFKSVNYIYDETKTPEQICQDYEKLLNDNPTDIIFMGVGENGHIAFNDPHVAFFDDPLGVKIVDLDQKCRNQQVNDGCFATIDDVPTHAFTLTIPSLTAAKVMICTVPAATKANAVYNTVKADITVDVPATIMRLHDNATMYCDADSGAKLL